jgi:hypothetical protein
MQADAPKPVALLPPANAASVLCSDLVSARAALVAEPGYGRALVLQRVRQQLAEEVNKARATFRIVR